MAKQSSLFKLRGKADGQSFYYSKNGEYLTRKINPGMSSRVKTAKEYANTRLNNKEFGAAGSCAGAMVRAVSSRWRYILDSIATGMLVKGIKEAMVQDTTHDWGKREVALADMPAIQDLYNKFSKNEIPQGIADYANSVLTYNTTTGKTVAEDAAVQSADFVSQMNAIGATGFEISSYVFGVSAPKADASGEGYAPETTVLALIRTDNPDVSVGNDLIDLNDYEVPATVQNAATHFGGILVVFKPVKTINGKNYVLQQHCSAYWKSLETYSE